MNLDRPRPARFAFSGFGRDRRREQDEERAEQLPYADLMSADQRGHLVACLGELIGTFLFLFFAFAGTQVANSQPSSTVSKGSDPARLLYISLSFGFSLAVNAWVFFRISGGLFNPAVTLGLCLVGTLSYLRGAILLIGQLVGAIAAAGVVSALFPGDLAVQTSLGAGTSVSQGLFIEMFLTTELLFAIYMLAAEKHRATFLAPVGIGLSLFVAELAGVYYTGGSLNPARSFGPSVVLRSFESYHWIYWLGPVLGTLLASAFYKLIKILEYETANPSPDVEHHSHSSHNHHHHHHADRGVGLSDRPNFSNDGTTDDLTIHRASDYGSATHLVPVEASKCPV